jgi:hypothetical protein
LLALFSTATVTSLTFVNNAITTGTKFGNLIGLVEQAKSVTFAHPLVKLLTGTSAKLVRLDALFANN